MARMKADAEKELRKIWDGEVLIKDVNPNGNNSFSSGFAAFAYKVLKGDERSVHKLIDKLFANKQEVDNKGDISLTLKIVDYARTKDKSTTEAERV